MIKTHYDALGNVSGFFDEEKGCWVAPPSTDSEAEVLDEPEDPPAADADDAEEPVDYTKYTKDQLKEMLTNANVDFPRTATKELLLDIIAEHNSSVE